MFGVSDLQAFGNWLRERRKYAGLTQAEAAKDAKISRVRWSQIERGKSKPRKNIVRRIVRAVNGRTERAFRLLGYPSKVIERARRSDRKDSSRLIKAESEFQEALLHSRSYTEAAFDLMDIYCRYHQWKVSGEVCSAIDPYEYQRAVEAAMALDPYHQWFLAKEIVLHLWETGRLTCLPEVPENEAKNLEQSRVLKILAKSIKELRLEARLRDATLLDEYQGKQRQK